MASKNLLDLVNDVILMTGDYSKLATVVGSPSNIAERIMSFLNLVIEDVATLDFPELRYDFVGTADGTSSIWDIKDPDVRPDSAVIVSVGSYPLEEVSPGRLQKYRIEGDYDGDRSRWFARGATSTGLLSVTIYPTPASGQSIEIVSYKRSTPFTLSDTATTELMNNNLLALGAIAYMDAFDGLNRGYMQRYEYEKQKALKQRYKNMQIRIEIEDYH